MLYAFFKKYVVAVSSCCYWHFTLGGGWENLVSVSSNFLLCSFLTVLFTVLQKC